MLRKLQYGCLVGSIALIGADRIDLLAGRGPFILRPFLALVPLSLLIGVFCTRADRIFLFAVTPPIRRQIPFLTASCLLLLFTLISIPFGLDPDRSLVTFVGFLLVVFLGYCISVQILAEPAQEKLIVHSITFALLVYLIFCIGECIAWSHGVLVTPDQETSSWIESTFAANTLFWAPRLAGFTIDPNRSGFVLVMYLALLDKYGTKSRNTLVLRCAIGLFILLTLSRSGMLCWFVYYLCSATVWRRLTVRRAVMWLGTIAIAGSIVYLAYETQINNLMEEWEISNILSDRLSGNEGTSGGEHIKLIQRGFDNWSTSAKTLFTGIGFGAAPKVLSDFFGDDKRGNFHSLYVTVLAEIGLPAFLTLMFLLGYPIVGRKGVVSWIAAIMVFNISYQSHMEPMLWTMLALAWSYQRRGAMNSESSRKEALMPAL